MRRRIVLGVIVAIGGLSIAAAAFQGAPAGRQGGARGPNVAGIEKVKDNLYMITGGGGNTAAFITDGGVVIVDTKLAGWGQAILDKVRTVSDKPVTMIINTHTHPDHTGSNEFFGPTVDVIAHEMTKANMAKMDAFKGAAASLLPKRTFKDTMTIGKGKDEIDLYYFGRAHTGGDAFVLFKTPRVVHAGDAFAGKNVPLVDTMNGGSVVDYGKTLAKASSTLKDYDTIITGHSMLMKPADLKEFADFNNDFAAWVQSEMKAGKTAEQAGAEYKIPEKYKGYGLGGDLFGGYKGNIQTAYNELSKK
jgi:glyoxylase-like metal-dependent hydrolase (beta-lactamase superfamily II)